MALPPPPFCPLYASTSLPNYSLSFVAEVPPLDLETRIKKILRYRMKREKRRFLQIEKSQKKQEQAAKRLRVKGRFVGKAAEMVLAGLGNSKNNVSLDSVSKAL